MCQLSACLLLTCRRGSSSSSSPLPTLILLLLLLLTSSSSSAMTGKHMFPSIQPRVSLDHWSQALQSCWKSVTVTVTLSPKNKEASLAQMPCSLHTVSCLSFTSMGGGQMWANGARPQHPWLSQGKVHYTVERLKWEMSVLLTTTAFFHKSLSVFLF